MMPLTTPIRHLLEKPQRRRGFRVATKTHEAWPRNRFFPNECEFARDFPGLLG